MLQEDLFTYKMNPEDFHKEMVAYRAAVAKAEMIRKPVVVLYALRAYEDDNGSQGTRFVMEQAEDTWDQLMEYINSMKSLSEIPLLIVNLHMAANEIFWTSDGKRAPDQPTRGLLRDSLRTWYGTSISEAHDTWLPVHSVRCGIEDCCATAVAECEEPEGWDDSHVDKYGIEIEFAA